MKNPNRVKRKDFDEVMVPCYSPMAMIPERGLGSTVWDQEGKDFIDFAGGIAVSCLGHCHPIMLDALNAQASKLWHVSNVMTNEPALRLAKRLIELSFAEKVFFANSGAEANEAALKLARRWALEHFGEEKNEIIAFHQGFHGRTFFTVTVGGQPTYSSGFGPKPQAVRHLPFNDLSALSNAISAKTCAVMIEPLQGEGGVLPADPDFLQGVRALCDQHQALLIFDEVQTGNGRTGCVYAYQHTNVIPDILTTAKSMGGGFPIGAMLTTSAIAAHMGVGTHGSTYGGNPLACAVADAVMAEIAKPQLLQGVLERSAWFREHLAHLNEKYQIFSQIRGQGLLLGAVLDSQWQGQARQFLTAAGEEGLLLLVAGMDVIRFTPALVISKEEVDQGMRRFERAIQRVIKATSSNKKTAHNG